MANIKKFTFTQRTINVYPDFWDEANVKFKPVEDASDVCVCEILDSITLAVEAGVIDSYLWPQQLFANRQAFEGFIEELSYYDECYRITDRWWTSLAQLVGVVDEEAFVSSQEIAKTLLEEASSEGRMENFGRKKPQHLFTKKQCAEALIVELKQSVSHGNFLTVDEFRPFKEMADFARHYSIQIPDDKYLQAEKEGNAILEATHKKVAAKKSATKIVSTS